MRDGVKLDANLYLTKGREATGPCIFTLTPYGASNYANYSTYFASRGLNFVVVDARGTGRSRGSFTPLQQEAHDGHDVVEWLAGQRYCGDRVAMWGGSYAGHVQWATAKEMPPHLATIVPVAAPYAGIDFPFSSHSAAPFAVQWLAYTARMAPQKFADPKFWVTAYKEFAESGTPLLDFDRRIGFASPMFQEWLAHPNHDDYWDRMNPTAEQYAALTLPILTITGSYDGDQAGALAHYRRHMQHASPQARDTHYLVIGPWDHGGTRNPALTFRDVTVGPASLVDMGQLHLDWYAWTLQGGRKPQFLQQRVAYYVIGADRWRYAETLDAVTAKRVPLYLGSNGEPTDVTTAGSLQMQQATGSDTYVYDPRDVSSAAVEAEMDPESLTDQRLVLANRGKHLVYETTPFPADTEVSGFFQLAAWISIDTPDTDFRAVIYEVQADGKSVELSRDILRARYRDSVRNPKLVTGSAPLRYDFDDFSFISQRVRKGNRLRLILGPNVSIYGDKNYNSGGRIAAESMQDARPATVVLYHSAEFPSALYVPLGPEE